jgi:endoplasmic reticulum resident protein 44
VPLVREITFDNAEELTDEGLPLLVLFHHIDDRQSLPLFERQLDKQLLHERCALDSARVSLSFSSLSSLLLAAFNCLHADGATFAHPLQHLGKSAADLPLLVIDSFQHMFLFDDFRQISYEPSRAEPRSVDIRSNRFSPLKNQRETASIR